jgi:hypothetical protein
MSYSIRFFACDAAVRRVGLGLLDRTLPRADWTHEAHLAACAWLLLERPDILPERDLPAIIRGYNVAVGGVNDDTQGYHETLTQLYILGVRLFLAGCSEASLLGKVNALLASESARRDWPLRFYSRERLFSVEARRGWIEPDLEVISL